MKSTDKFLMGIVAGVLLLAGVAFVVALLQPKPTFQSDETPEGVAYNYLFALEQQDYARAYGYLSSSLLGYPKSAETFKQNVKDNSYTFTIDDSTTLSVDSSRLGDGSVTIKMRTRQFSRGGLFGGSEYDSTFDMELARERGIWKITSSQQYWLRCWTQSGGCR